MWEVVDVATSNLKSLKANRPRSNPNDLPQDGTDHDSKTLSLPSSPVVKEQPRSLRDQKSRTNMDLKLSGHGSSTAGVKTVVSKRPFLEGFRQTLKPRSKSDEFSEEAKQDPESDKSTAQSPTGSTGGKPYLETSLGVEGAEKAPSGLVKRWSETPSTAKYSPGQVRLLNSDKPHWIQFFRMKNPTGFIKTKYFNFFKQQWLKWEK